MFVCIIAALQTKKKEREKYGNWSRTEGKGE